MTQFHLYKEAFYFAVVYGIILLIGCVPIVFIGKKMITKLGQYPTKTPAIQMSVIWQLLLVQAITFTLLIGFFRFFE